MAQTTGSSPRLRGTRGEEIHDCVRRRFIPAPAGNTINELERLGVPAVHPRACGEHSFGKRRQIELKRFIPAPAGNTCCLA